MYCLTIILGVISLVLQSLVIYYGVRLYRFIGYVNYWSCAWKFYIVAQAIIFMRRFVGLIFLSGCPAGVIKFSLYEILLTIIVSILLLMFVRSLNVLFRKYVFKKNGV